MRPKLNATITFNLFSKVRFNLHKGMIGKVQMYKSVTELEIADTQASVEGSLQVPGSSVFQALGIGLQLKTELKKRLRVRHVTNTMPMLTKVFTFDCIEKIPR